MGKGLSISLFLEGQGVAKRARGGTLAICVCELKCSCCRFPIFFLGGVRSLCGRQAYEEGGGGEYGGQLGAEYVDAEGYAEGGGGAEGYGAEDPAAAGWEAQQDEEGNPYWYNSATGESTYEDPAGGGGGGAEWEEAWDEEGNPYWHNATTGDSTYDSPFE